MKKTTALTVAISGAVALGAWVFKKKIDNENKIKVDNENKINNEIKECPHCKGEFRNIEMHKLLGVKYCASCHDKIIGDSYRVTTYPYTYKGKIERSDKSIYRTSSYYRDKDEALNELEIQAAVENCKTVYDVEYDYTTREDGNYVYKVWYASGTLT